MQGRTSGEMLREKLDKAKGDRPATLCFFLEGAGAQDRGRGSQEGEGLWESQFHPHLSKTQWGGVGGEGSWEAHFCMGGQKNGCP